MNITVLGAGESGVGAALLAKQQGHGVFVSDGKRIHEKFRKELIDNEIEFESGQHSFGIIYHTDLVVKSPGIPDDSSVVKICKRADLPVISEIEFASRFTDATIVGITGSNGKTTTALLTYHLLKTAGKNVRVGGNVGVSFARLLCQAPADIYVLELSSFQLDGIDKFKPRIAMLLNITPDHLDRYQGQLKKYGDAKFRIVKEQDEQDYFIYYRKDKEIRSRLEKANYPGTIISTPEDLNSGEMIRLENNIEIDFKQSSLKGPHNKINAFCALRAAQLLGAEANDLQAGLNSFVNAPHRLEVVAVIDEVTYINDSKATNVDATFFALQAMPQNIIWIAGGIDKGNDYSDLLGFVKEKVKAMICLGVDNKKLVETFSGIVPGIEESQQIEEAVKRAQELAKPGDIVLLSPACSSFDLFRNYIQRGEHFKREVNALKK